ncbi:hypothetical protein ARMSODRAFT_367562 [Armillaria solidipes]|uniref:Uncharacterized protein n=1 Tax=Armillaria solidipes TaxID=1076256 RepID=A0A2H3B8P9_9AGAR|nr:hypothetical protein ARMSODRAFT_367562 [Armillaria solidipes]
MANAGSEELSKQVDAQRDLKMTEPATVECNEQDFWLQDKWPLQAVLANLEKIKATVREKEGEDSDTYKKCLQHEERYRSLLANIP